MPVDAAKLIEAFNKRRLGSTVAQNLRRTAIPEDAMIHVAHQCADQNHIAMDSLPIQMQVLFYDLLLAGADLALAVRDLSESRIIMPS